MTDFCILCLTELGCTDSTGWFYNQETTEAICPWCIKDIIAGIQSIESVAQEKTTNG